MINNGYRIKLDADCLRHMSLFQSVTKASAKDCLIDLDKILFVVNTGQAGMAIGKEGVNIKNLQRLVKKKVEIVEFNSNLIDFLNNVFRPIKVKDISDAGKNDGKRVIKITIESGDHINPKAFIKGKIKRTRDLIKKYFDVDEVLI
ncbi:MAG TPA: NusA-like transcription termination signal-binding factor [Candidatus Nanoarchaeia archaeon]|nr:NusA-like transcription termination signal-binding factor [Candidatus Nanoarchaeia archaeon]